MRNTTLFCIIPMLPLAFAGLVASAQTPGPSGSAASASEAATARSSPDTALTVSFGGFVDNYYAYDFGRPVNFDRPFTTQAARHNEFNVNLAFIEARVSGPRVRGRLALQAGTSVQSNYAGEPTIGAVSGPDLSRFIQEAVAGYQITPSLWVDGGIFFSHIGEEGFISRDNLTYTRSLSADFTPYYESGVKLTWQPTPRLTALLTVVNGWQNISENNQDKAAGARFDFARSSSTTFSYYNFVGNEAASNRLRVFNGVGFKSALTAAFTLQGNFDYGTQQKAPGTVSSSWFSTGIIGKEQLTQVIGISGRVERYQDPEQVIVATGSPDGFKATTASLGVDVSPVGPTRALWRNEVRGTWAGDPVFPNRSASTGTAKSDALLVTSLALTF
jgi:Putative beta-barrel porin-2, OmpL-like. bbp2